MICEYQELTRLRLCVYGLNGVENTFTYYGLWAAGTSFGICAWDALHSNAGNDFLRCVVVGDPFVTK
jgi:hypothetical protein